MAAADTISEEAEVWASVDLVVESRGWQYEVWCEPPAVEVENVRFLAGYRRDWLFDHELSLSFAPRISTVPRWRWHAGRSRNNRRRWCDLLSSIRCGNSTSRSI
jgi:hypothetical protein